MARLILKKSSVVEDGVPKQPAVGDLEYGELAINYAVGTLYYKKSDNTIGAIGAGAAPGNGTLTLQAQAGLTNTSVSIGTGTGFSANTATNTTYQVNVGPALSALAGTMTGAGTGFLRKSGVDTYEVDTTTYASSASLANYLPLAGGTITGAVSITNSTASSSTTTGALIVTGGVGVGGNLSIAKAIQMSSTLDNGLYHLSTLMSFSSPGSDIFKIINGRGTAYPAKLLFQSGYNQNTYGAVIGGAGEIRLETNRGTAFVSTAALTAINNELGASGIVVIGNTTQIYNNLILENSGSLTAGAISATNVTISGELRGPATMYIDPAAVGDNTGTLVIRGNLQVDGTTTTINSTTVAIDDLNLQLATDAPNAAAANGAGISVGGASATFIYTSADDRWNLNKNLNVGTVYGALSGNATTATNATYLYGSTHIYVSPSNANTLNSGFGGAADGYDIWINYRGYNDNFSYYRDFRVGDGRGNEIALFTGSAQSLNVKGAITQNGNQVLHASNYSSYALPLTGGTLTGNLTINPTSNQSLSVQHDGTGTAWFGRIVSRNSSMDKAAFLGTYGGVAGVFAHNNALSAWAPLYINTIDSGAANGTGQAVIFSRLQLDADGTDSWYRAGSGNRHRFTTTGGADFIIGNGSGVITINGNQLLHAGNYSSYALPLTGGTLTGDLQVNTIRDTGGVWILGKYNGEISLGSASAVNDIVFNSSADANFKYRTNPILHAGNYTSYTPKIVYGNSGSHNLDTVGTAQHAEFRFSQGAWGGTNPFPGNYSHVLSFNAATDNRTVQLYLGDVPGAIYWRMHQGNSTLHPWERILTSNNYGSYAPTLTGGGASGTWGINITGTASGETLATVAGRGNSYGGTISIGNNGSNTGLQINHGAGNGDYGIIRFYQNGTNNQTIHVFSTSWQGGTLAGQSSGAINLAGANGVTFGSWNDLAGWIDNSGNMTIKAAFSAATKSFVIPHPTKPGKKLRYGSLEGPENGVYVRGRLQGTDCIQLPDYWTGLVHADSITVNLTAASAGQQLYVERVENNCVYIVNETGKPVSCFYTVYGERKDVDKLEVEID